MPSPFPDPSREDQRHMRRLAWAIVRRVGHQSGDQTALAQDLEMAGWEDFYRHFGHRHVWLKVYGAMINAWCFWRWGVGYHGNNKVHRKVTMIPLEDWHPVVEEDLQREARDTLRALCLTLEKPRYRGLKGTLEGTLLADGMPLDQAEQERLEIRNSVAFYRQRLILRRLVTDLQQGAA